MSDYILEVNHITKEFSGVRALDDANIKVKRGEIHALCGENGAEKFTLMNILSGVYPFDSYNRNIVYNDNMCQLHSIKQSEVKSIIIIHQKLALSPYISVAGSVFLGDERRAAKGIVGWTLTHKRAQEVLEKTGLGGGDLSAPISSLGAGKRQLIGIAKAIAKKVELLILDEPTAALNDEESRRFLNVALDLEPYGVASIIISHKLNEISYVIDSITIVRDRRTIETLEKGRDELTGDRIIKGIMGRELADRYSERYYEIGDAIFETGDWSVCHPDDARRQVIKGVSLHVHKGEVVDLAGLMGAGRTEPAMSIFGRSYGQKIGDIIKIDSRKVYMEDVKNVINNKLTYMSENRKNYGPVLTKDIKWNITLSAMRNFFSKNSALSENDEILATEGYKKKVNIKFNFINQTVDSLSGGNQQKMALVKRMLTQPDVLILDGPTRGTDVGARYETYCAINELAKSGKTVVVTSSEMQEVIGTCDCICVANRGRTTGELAKEEVVQGRIMKCIIADSGKKV